MAKVQRLPIDSAPLVTIDETADVVEQYAGHFVRIRPTAHATDKEVAGLKRALLRAGACAVRVMPRPPADRLQLSAPARVVENLMVDDAVPPVRELVAELVKHSTSRHKDELGALLERLADEEGL